MCITKVITQYPRGSMVEHLPSKQEVAGSSPAAGVFILFNYIE